MKWLRRPSELAVHARPDEPIDDLGRGHLWILDLDRADVGSSNPRDVGLSQAYRRPIDRRRFLARCDLVKSVLGSALGAPPDSLEFGQSECGKPWVKQSGDRVNFSISHAENALGLVLVGGREAGLDIEFVNTGIDFRALEAWLPMGRETSVPPQSSDLRASYLAWTREEAIAKMNGHGIGSKHMQAKESLLPFSLDSFEFAFDGRNVVGTVALSVPLALPSAPASLWNIVE